MFTAFTIPIHWILALAVQNPSESDHNLCRFFFPLLQLDSTSFHVLNTDF